MPSVPAVRDHVRPSEAAPSGPGSLARPPGRPDLDATTTDPPPFVGQPGRTHDVSAAVSPWAPAAASDQGPGTPVIGGSPESSESGPPVPSVSAGDAAGARFVDGARQQTYDQVDHQAGQMSADALVRRRAHGDSALRRVGRGVRKAVGASAAGDLRETTGVAQRIQSPVPSCRRIAVTSIRGGAGKTTVAALLAAVIAEHRDDRVLAMDADSGLGSLPLRLGAQPERSMHDLAAAQPRSWEETAQFLATTEQGLWLLSATARGRVSELELETFQTAAAGVGRYFSAAVIDCGAGIVARLQRGVLASAHAQVFVTPGTVDGALSARQTLSWFVGSGYEELLSRTVVALVTHSPHADGDADLERARQVLSDGGLPVVVVPYDRHLATGTAISPARVSGTVRAAASWIAAEVFARSLTGGAV
ncbi:MinD-like ATPase involved in chromosome partitioning or flagellar assembly [Thermomonospora umbrina]|uniref:MinD-like ATPase involved in chromosome partitioning or flagellar assembly n=2 Tax=Thermomonospora umbrina TaxID=111806 RepID=A0A3D9SKW4_9ACTN|nr:MinD-like ATPase involved in chromosome partitioning or flagellar assembly [Thermomonospora umbrina]